MDDALRKQILPGAKVRVTQQIAARDYSLASDVTGTVLEFGQKQTGSWYAHSKNDKLWLDRLLIRKDDGELTTLNLDDYSHVEILGLAWRHRTTQNAGAVSQRTTSHLKPSTIVYARQRSESARWGNFLRSA